MAHEDYDFKGQLKYEHVKFFFRTHWVHFIQPILFSFPVFLLLLLVLTLLGQLAARLDLFLFSVSYLFFAMMVTILFLNFFFLYIFNYYFHLVIVTDVRILCVRKTVFLKNNTDAIDLTKIQDIGVEAHGILRNYLQYGQLVITLSTSSPPFTISYAPKPHFNLERINRVKREHILQRKNPTPT